LPDARRQQGKVEIAGAAAVKNSSTFSRIASRAPSNKIIIDD
jgi:hypothetical protein